MTPEQKNQIDAMDYESMLRLWRFSPLGHPNPMFSGDTGDYFSKVMQEKRESVDHVAISKRIGWDK